MVTLFLLSMIFGMTGIAFAALLANSESHFLISYEPPSKTADFPMTGTEFNQKFINTYCPYRIVFDYYYTDDNGATYDKDFPQNFMDSMGYYVPFSSADYSEDYGDIQMYYFQYDFDLPTMFFVSEKTMCFNDCANMFSELESHNAGFLSYLYFYNFDTRNCHDFSHMFYGTGLDNDNDIVINMSGFDMENAYECDEIFSDPYYYHIYMNETVQQALGVGVAYCYDLNDDREYGDVVNRYDYPYQIFGIKDSFFTNQFMISFNFMGQQASVPCTAISSFVFDRYDDQFGNYTNDEGELIIENYQPYASSEPVNEDLVRTIFELDLSTTYSDYLYDNVGFDNSYFSPGQEIKCYLVADVSLVGIYSLTAYILSSNPIYIVNDPDDQIPEDMSVTESVDDAYDDHGLFSGYGSLRSGVETSLILRNFSVRYLNNRKGMFASTGFQIIDLSCADFYAWVSDDRFNRWCNNEYDYAEQMINMEDLFAFNIELKTIYINDTFYQWMVYGLPDYALGPLYWGSESGEYYSKCCFYLSYNLVGDGGSYEQLVGNDAEYAPLAKFGSFENAGLLTFRDGVWDPFPENF